MMQLFIFDKNKFHFTILLHRNFLQGDMVENKYKNMVPLELFFAFFSIDFCIAPLNKKAFPLRHLIRDTRFTWELNNTVGKLCMFHEGMLVNTYTSRDDGADPVLIESLEYTRDKLTKIFRNASLQELYDHFIQSYDPRLEIIAPVNQRTYQNFKDAAYKYISVSS
jgi:hypothetical protein